MQPLNGAQIIRRAPSAGSNTGTIFIPLPEELWTPAGPCTCQHCQGAESYWDTVALATTPRPHRSDTTWTVHMPEAHSLTWAGIRGAAERLARDRWENGAPRSVLFNAIVNELQVTHGKLRAMAAADEILGSER